MRVSQNEPAKSLTGLEIRSLGAKNRSRSNKGLSRQNQRVNCWQLAEGAKLPSGRQICRVLNRTFGHKI